VDIVTDGWLEDYSGNYLASGIGFFFDPLVLFYIL